MTYPSPPTEGQPGALANWEALNDHYEIWKDYVPGDFAGPGGGGGSQSELYGGSAPYSMSPSAGAGAANRTALLLLITHCQAQGKVGILPQFFSSGVPVLMKLPPTEIQLDGDRWVEIRGAVKGAGFKQVVDTVTGLAYKANTPASGFAADVNSNIPGNENYWIFVDGATSGGSILWKSCTLEGGHGANSASSDPNGASEATWLQWGIGLRVPRHGKLIDTIHGGNWANIQLDGDYDHTYMENVDSAGGWHNLRFGPRQNERDNVFVNCKFSNSSFSGISVARTGFLAGSSFHGGHIGTQPYGVYFEPGAKSSGLNMQIQNVEFNEIIWEGCGNYKIFCEDGDTRIDAAGFAMAQLHGLEVGDQSNIHVRYCSIISNVARAATGVVTVTVDTLGGIAAGQYVIMNGYGSQPVQGVKVGGGAADTSLCSVFRVLTAVGTTVTMQGSNTTVVASGSVPTSGASGSGRAWLARVGCVRAGRLTGWRGDLQITGDEVDMRDQGGYGTAAELFFDIINFSEGDVFDDTYLPNFGPRMAYTLLAEATYWRSVRGRYFLAKIAGTIPKKAAVQLSGATGSVVVTTGSAPPVGVVGGTSAATHPTSPAGTYHVTGEFCWVQEGGVAEVLGSGSTPQGGSIAAASPCCMVADAGGQVKTLAAGTAPTAGAAGQFKAGAAVGVASATTSVIKLGLS